MDLKVAKFSFWGKTMQTEMEETNRDINSLREREKEREREIIQFQSNHSAFH